MNCRVIQKNKVSLLNWVLWVLKLQFCFTPETFVHLIQPNVSTTQVEQEELSLPEHPTRERWSSINSLQRPAMQTGRTSMTMAGFLLLKSLAEPHFYIEQEHHQAQGILFIKTMFQITWIPEPKFSVDISGCSSEWKNLAVHWNEGQMHGS